MVNSLTYKQPLTGGTNISRREFIKAAGAALAGAALLAIGEQLIAAPSLAELPETALLRSTFASHLGDLFRVYQGSDAVLALRLAAVRDLRATAHLPATVVEQPEHTFSLLFAGPADRVIAQDLYRFEHPLMGVFSMFIVPMAPVAGARYYEAIFNRLPE